MVKGWTRASVVALFLLAASELDINDPACQEKLKPMYKVLDRAWTIPCHVPVLEIRVLKAFCSVFL